MPNVSVFCEPASASRGAVILAMTAAVTAAPQAGLAADSSLTWKRSVTQLAEGVYAIRHVDPFPSYVHGNTTVVIGEREVLVVDSCRTASAAREDIAEIRGWTDKPVRYLVNTHWHQDHNAGNRVYLDAYPGLAILAHAETRAMLDAAPDALPRDVLKTIPEAAARASQLLASGQASDGKPLSDRRLRIAQGQVTLAPAMLEDARNFVYQAPTLTFEDQVTLDLGGREVRVWHPGRANTGGDLVVYLPQAKILVAGDLVVRPVPYTFDGYPREWIRALEAIGALDVDLVVPGHGDLLRGKEAIFLLRDLMRTIVAQVNAQVDYDANVTLDAVRQKVDFTALRDRILGEDRAEIPFFDYAMSSFIELAYHEAKQR